MAPKDSIGQALNAVQSRMASYRDHNQGIVMDQQRSPLVKMQMEMEMLAGAKAEVAKNFEMAKISIKSKQPYIRSLDAPRPPLKPTIPSWKKNMLIGAIIASFLP